MGFGIRFAESVVEQLRTWTAAERPRVPPWAAGMLEHLYDGLVRGGADAALVASIFHYGEHTVGEAKAFLAARGVLVRPVA